jgi:phosphatidylglycerophosphatase A
MVKFIVTIFYVGLLPKAPGTFGSIAAILIGYWIQLFGGLPLLMFSIIVCFFSGWALTNLYLSKNSLRHDPQEIVIDEVTGQWISYLPISLYIWVFESNISLSTWFTWVIALILFRIFDIWKPWPISWADKKHTSLGVMLDDVLAGIYAASIISVIIIVSKLGGIL